MRFDNLSVFPFVFGSEPEIRMENEDEIGNESESEIENDNESEIEIVW